MKDRLRKRRQSMIGVAPRLLHYRSRRNRANRFAYAVHHVMNSFAVGVYAIETLARYTPKMDVRAWAADVEQVIARMRDSPPNSA